MANTKTFAYAIDSTRENVTVTDSITYTNPLRADVAIFFEAAKVDFENTETALTTTPDDDDPLTDASWSFSYGSGDGWYKLRYIAVPEYDVSDTYALYDACYSGGVVYRSKSAGNVGNPVSSTVYFEVVSDPTTLCDNKGEDNESANCDSTIVERVFTSNAQYAYGNLLAENCMCTDCDESEILQEYDVFSLWLNAAIKCDERTEPISGEIIARKIQSRFID